MPFTDEERKRILDEARRSIKELKDFKPRTAPVFVSEDPMVRWRREAAEAEQRKVRADEERRRCEAETMRTYEAETMRATQQTWDDWENWLQRHLEREREHLFEVLTEGNTDQRRKAQRGRTAVDCATIPGPLPQRARARPSTRRK
jgi:hypothetical protein